MDKLKQTLEILFEKNGYTQGLEVKVSHVRVFNPTFTMIQDKIVSVTNERKRIPVIINTDLETLTV